MSGGATPDGGGYGQPGPVAAWVIAARPATLPAAVAPVLVGTAMAAYRGVMAVWPAVAALAGALLIQVATNLANDYFDFRQGSDSADRLGPTRVVQAGFLAPETVLRGTVVVMVLAGLVGLYLVWVGGWPILIVGLLSLFCAIAYTGGPFPLAYHGLGDPFVFVFFGLVAVAGTYWVQALALPTDLFLAGAGVGALTTAILVVNNLRDIGTDGISGKRTLAVRLGETGTQIEFVVLVILAAGAPPLGVVAYGWPAWTLLALVGLGPAVLAIDTVLTHVDPRELNPALREVARGVTWYGGLLATGFVLGLRF